MTTDPLIRLRELGQSAWLDYIDCNLIENGGRDSLCAPRLPGPWKDMMATPEWQGLARQGARAQCLLWASTRTKNPDYGELKYVEPLIAPGTVTTLTPETLDAYRYHGDPQVRGFLRQAAFRDRTAWERRVTMGQNAIVWLPNETSGDGQ